MPLSDLKQGLQQPTMDSASSRIHRLRELRDLAERIRINQREKRRENLEKVNLRRAAAQIRRRRAADASQNAFYPDASQNALYPDAPGSHNEPISYNKPASYDTLANYGPNSFDKPASHDMSVNYDKPASHDMPVNYDMPASHDMSVNYDMPNSYGEPVDYDKPPRYGMPSGPRDIEKERRRFNKLMGRQDPLIDPAYWEDESDMPLDDSDDMPPGYDMPPINSNKAFRHALPTPHSLKWWNKYRDPDWDPETAHVIPPDQIRRLSPQPETPMKAEFDWNLTNNPDSVLASTPLVTNYDLEEPQTPQRSPVPEKSQKPPVSPTLSSPIVVSPPVEGEDTNADPPDETRDALRALSRKWAKTSSPIIYDDDWDPVARCPKKTEKHDPPTDDVPTQPTNPGRAEEAREQEALQLRSMNSRLSAASRSIRDAYRTARQLVNSVDTAELMGHKCKACETCGHSEQHPIVMICTGIKRLFLSDNGHERTNLTWFGLIFMIISLWYMSEIAISEFFGTTDYASTMHGYGVFPDSPRYPFALLTLISWIPPFNWLISLFKANVFYEATKTVH